MSKMPSKYKIILFAVVCLFTAVLLQSCAATRKIDAASILSKTKLEFKELALDSVTINPELFEQVKNLKSTLLPNPQVVLIVQNLARGIIEKELGKAHLTAVMTANNQSTDTLWVRNLKANLFLDTLIELPLQLKDSTVLLPGASDITLTTDFPLDKRLLSLTGITKYRAKGEISVSLEAEGPLVSFDFDIEHPISPEEMRALEDRARKSLLDGLVSDWVYSIFPKE
jgi:hypothetical protein